MRSLARLTRNLKKLIPLYLMSKNEKEHVVTCDKGLTCDKVDESLLPLTLFVAHPLLPHLVVMVSLVMPH
jgi:hypothetical protein